MWRKSAERRAVERSAGGEEVEVKPREGAVVDLVYEVAYKLREMQRIYLTHMGVGRAVSIMMMGGGTGAATGSSRCTF